MRILIVTGVGNPAGYAFSFAATGRRTVRLLPLSMWNKPPNESSVRYGAGRRPGYTTLMTDVQGSKRPPARAGSFAFCVWLLG
jgi:hypothetical protein